MAFIVPSRLPISRQYKKNRATQKFIQTEKINSNNYEKINEYYFGPDFIG